MSADDDDLPMETLDILSDAKAMAGIRQADADIGAGRFRPLEGPSRDARPRKTA
jgi:antitoxin YefM